MNVRLWWQGLGLLRWPSLLLVGAAVVLASLYEAVPLRWVPHGERSLGGLELTLSTRGRVRAGRPVKIRLEAEGQPLPPLDLEIVGGDRVPVSLAKDPAFETSLDVPEETADLQIRVVRPSDGLEGPTAMWSLGPPL